MGRKKTKQTHKQTKHYKSQQDKRKIKRQHHLTGLVKTILAWLEFEGFFFSFVFPLDNYKYV